MYVPPFDVYKPYSGWKQCATLILLQYQGDLSWDSRTQGLVLGSSSYGTICTCLLGGWFSHRFGAKYVFGGSIFAASALTLLTPLAARYHYGVVIFIQTLQGFANVSVPWKISVHQTKKRNAVCRSLNFSQSPSRGAIDLATFLVIISINWDGFYTTKVLRRNWLNYIFYKELSYGMSIGEEVHNHLLFVILLLFQPFLAFDCG